MAEPPSHFRKLAFTSAGYLFAYYLREKTVRGICPHGAGQSYLLEGLLTLYMLSSAVVYGVILRMFLIPIFNRIPWWPRENNPMVIMLTFFEALTGYLLGTAAITFWFRVVATSHYGSTCQDAKGDFYKSHNCDNLHYLWILRFNTYLFNVVPECYRIFIRHATNCIQVIVAVLLALFLYFTEWYFGGGGSAPRNNIIAPPSPAKAMPPCPDEVPETPSSPCGDDAGNGQPGQQSSSAEPPRENTEIITPACDVCGFIHGDGECTNGGNDKETGQGSDVNPRDPPGGDCLTTSSLDYPLGHPHIDMNDERNCPLWNESNSHEENQNESNSHNELQSEEADTFHNKDSPPPRNRRRVLTESSQNSQSSDPQVDEPTVVNDNSPVTRNTRRSSARIRSKAAENAGVPILPNTRGGKRGSRGRGRGRGG